MNHEPDILRSSYHLAKLTMLTNSQNKVRCGETTVRGFINYLKKYEKSK